MTINNGRDYKDVEVPEGGYPVYGSGGEFRRASDFLYDGESILFGRKGTIDKPLYVEGKFWTVDTMFYAIPNELSCAKFLYYLATTIPYDYYVTSTALPSISQGDLAAHSVALPPLEEQQAIAEYLDRETQRIDELIAEQRGLIETLRERRRAVAMRAVTVGIGGEAIGDFGDRTIGDVPRSWEVRPVKAWMDSLDGQRVPLSATERADRTGPYAYYGASGVIDHVDDYIFDEPLVLVSEDGANLLMRSTPIAFVASGKYWVNNHAHVYRATDGESRFWSERIEAVDVAPFVTGSAQPKLTAGALGRVRLSAPVEIEERRRIAEYIEDQTSRIDALIAESADLIALSQERRAALITAAVTGQIDVRTAT